MALTRIWGDRKLSPTVTIESGVSDTLTLEANGVPYTITLMPGAYEVSHELFTGELLLAEINFKLSSQNAPVTAKLGGIHWDNPKTVLVLESEVEVTIDETSNAYPVLIGSIFQVENDDEVEEDNG